MRQRFLFSLFILITFQVFSQGESNIWYFGENAGIDFNSGAPVALTNGAIQTIEGCATISTPQGNLLFYTDGRKVYNNAHAIMPNGSGLLGSSSSSQSAVIVPQPGSTTLFYIFTVAREAEPDGLNYSIVDITLDNGLGDLTTKNEQIYTPSSEKLAAVKHTNGEDVWLITHQLGNNNFSTYLITSAGLNTTPVVSSVGVELDAISFSNNAIGILKLSPDGKKLGMTCEGNDDFTQLFDFNATTGEISNPIDFPVREADYGIEFSSSSDVLYVSQSDIHENKIFQYDMTAADIVASEILIADNGTTQYGQMQLGPDYKIYVSVMIQETLSVINNPNVLGVGCNYTHASVSLAGKKSYIGLPGFIQSNFNSEFQIANQCLGDQTQFSFNTLQAYDSVLWDFGDGSTSTLVSPVHEYNTPGDFIASLSIITGGSTAVDTKIITIYDTPIAYQPEDISGCDDDTDGFLLVNFNVQRSSVLNGQSVIDNTITYHISLEDAENNSDALDTDYTNTENPQTIYVRIENDESPICYSTISFQIIVNEQPVLTMDDEYSLCGDTGLEISADAGYDEYLWSTLETTRSIIVFEAGNYTVTATNSYGNVVCETTKTVTVNAIDIATNINIDIIDWTQNDNSITIMVKADGDYEYSIDGINYQDSNQFFNLQIGDYSIFVRDKEGCSAIEKEVFLLSAPSYFTPNGDGINDTWHVFNANKEPNNEIIIYNRFGKLIAEINANKPGWDGTLKGKPLPETDYWYVVIRQDGKRFTGHFALVR